MSLNLNKISFILKEVKLLFIQSTKNMISRPKLFISIVCLISLYACKTKETNDIKKAEWLLGTWENKTQQGITYETWCKINDKEFSGESCIVKEKDTIVFENIQLVQEKDGLYYTPTVKNQNDGLPVRFANRSISETKLIFENSKHNFPQIISYIKISADSLVAEISGIINGQESKQTFPMKRVK